MAIIIVHYCSQPCSDTIRLHVTAAAADTVVIKIPEINLCNNCDWLQINNKDEATRLVVGLRVLNDGWDEHPLPKM